MSTGRVSARLDFGRRVIAVTAMSVGAPALIGGWWLDNALLRSLLRQHSGMKANPIVALSAAGLALLFAPFGIQPGRCHRGCD